MKLKFDNHTLVSLVTGMITTLANDKAESIVDMRRAQDARDQKDNDLYKVRTDLREMTYSRDNYKESAEYAERRLDSVNVENNNLRAEVSKLRKDNIALRQAQGLPTSSALGFTQEQFDQVVDLIHLPYGHGGNKINAIKIVREVMGIGLKEAKDLVEDGKTFVHGAFAPSDQPAPPDHTKDDLMGKPSMIGAGLAIKNHLNGGAFTAA